MGSVSIEPDGAIHPSLRCEERLDELRELADDWYDEGSKAPSEEALARAESLLRKVPGLDRLAAIFPTYEGGVQLEWESDRSWSVEITDSVVEVHGVVTEGEEDPPLKRFGDLKRYGGVEDALVEFLRRSVGDVG